LHKIDSPDSRSRRLSPRNGRKRERQGEEKGTTGKERREKKGFKVNTRGSSGSTGEKKRRGQGTGGSGWRGGGIGRAVYQNGGYAKRRAIGAGLRSRSISSGQIKM